VTLHGSAVLLKSVDFEPSAVFLRGLSGSGKSDLVFRLIETGGQLVSDDQVTLERRAEKIYATPVAAIRGLLEVRGIGLLHYPVAEAAPLRLVVDLVAREDVPRLPEPETVELLGLEVPRFKLHAFDASAAYKVLKAMAVAHKPALAVK
jgi:serine kinase of HPr protein (carbohydrate metabolism regulator)